ncbi:MULTISPECIES: 3D domain-containing protein [unclassified Clostridium]|uniref:3D domain-containing protein n=1 Tax=Clostridium TaxID=1485 RepID=UPI0021AB5B96|nr:MULTISPECIES: 3D domain-containing protein [unclassified Clostridium]MDU2289271.1 3D domain-containing protein [Clostridium celatum]
MFKKFITVSLATALLTSSLSFISVYAATPQDTINENLQKYQTLDNQILELNSKIQALDVEIDQTTIKLNENNTAIADIEDQIKTNEAKLEQTKEDIENSQVVLDNRVRTMYKTNMTSNILVSIITSKSVSELFSKVQAISKIISTDKEVLATINEKKSELDSTIESLNNKNSELVVLKKTIEEDLKTVESKKAEQEQYVEQLNSEKESVFSVIEENEKLLISKPLSIANSSSASASELQNAIDTLNSYIPLLNSSTTINMAKNGISNAKARIDELNTPTVPTTGTEVGTAIKTLTMESTAYYGHATTASGLKPVRNPDGISTVAVDPNVIPLGSKVYVSGYGVAIAADTGGAIKGNIIDVYLNSYEECMSWGRRQVTVQILEYP